MEPRHPIPRPVVALLMIPLVAAVTLWLPERVRSAPEPVGPIVTTRTIAPGLTYTKITQRKIPRRTYVLRIDLAEDVTLDTTIADAALPSRDQLSDIVKRAGALAGVNGDFFATSGEPIHVFAQDGELLHTSRAFGRVFGVTRDESQVLFGKPQTTVTVTDTSTGEVLELDHWNDGGPAPGELVGFSPIGGTLERPPGFACSARLLPQGPSRVADPNGVDRDFVVDVDACSAEPLPRQGGVVLSAAPATKEAAQLLTLSPGTNMLLHWTVGWTNVFDVMAGGPMLLQDGNVVGVCASECGAHPRTGVGVTAQGQILLVVVDGRQPRWSRGLTIVGFARMMHDLGAVTAMNLDGGGSSEMVVEGKVVNRPSDGRERSISSAMVVLPGTDPGET